MYQHILVVGIHGLSYYIASVYLPCTGSCAADCFPHCCESRTSSLTVAYGFVMLIDTYSQDPLLGRYQALKVTSSWHSFVFENPVSCAEAGSRRILYDKYIL